VNAASGDEFTLYLKDDSSNVENMRVNFDNITIKLESSSAASDVSVTYSMPPNPTGPMFRIDNNSTLVIGNGIILQGTNTSTSFPVVSVGGNRLGPPGTFKMTGGEIRGNHRNLDGAGVFVGFWGTFIKTGGKIYGNNADSAYQNISGGGSGGDAVYVSAYSSISNSPGGIYKKSDTDFFKNAREENLDGTQLFAGVFNNTQ
jgi:hypothetical protein